MKLLLCNIVSFGGLSDFQLNFNQGLNTLCKHNGWGKTTLAVFIKSMLYGLASDGKQVTNNELIKYKPLGKEGKFGGSLTFENNGKQYRVTRFFGESSKRAKTLGSCELIDLQTNKKVEFTEPLGEYILGINAQAYERSCYLPQKEIILKSDKDPSVGDASISNKLSTLLYNTGSENNFAVVMGRLDDKRKQYRLKKGEGGSIYEATRSVDELRQRLLRAEQSVETITTSSQRLIAVREQIRGSEKRLQEVRDKINHAREAEMRNSVQQTYKSMKSNLEIEIERNKPYEPYQELNQTQLTELESRANKVTLDEQLLTQQTTTSRQDKLMKVLLAFLTVTCLATLIAGILLHRDSTLLTILLCVSGLCLVGSVAFALLLVKMLKGYAYKDNLHREAVARISNERKYIEGVLSRYGVTNCELTQGVYTLRVNYDKYLSNCEKIGRDSEQLQNFYQSNDLSKMEDIPTESVAELNNEQMLLTDRLNSARQEEGSLNEQIAYSRSEADQLESLKASIEQKEKELIQLTRECDIVDNCIRFLDSAKESLQTAYLPRLQNRFEHYLQLAGLDKNSYVLDNERNVAVKIDERQHNTDYLSLGYKDIVEFCARLALCDCLDEHKSFIILDDPFVNLDDERQTLAMQLLERIASQYQILYLVCHTSRA